MMATGEGNQRLERRTGKRLLEHARTIVEAATTDEPVPEPPDISVLEEKRGVFVTLNQDGELRGCIGRPRPEQSLAQALEAAATGAATSDPRFPRLTSAELDNITVSISVLTPPQPLPAVDPDEIEIGRDGVILTKGSRRGLLLPQVAVDQDWTAEQFLQETARKAGLRPDAWRADETLIKRFSAQVFSEVSPGGAMTVEDYTHGAESGKPTD